jgi:hypothetical protein
MARRSARPPLSPHPLISFEPRLEPGNHLIHVALDPASKRWGFHEAAPEVAEDVEDTPDVPTDLEYPFNDQIEAIHAALNKRASSGNMFRIVRNPESGRWGFHETPRRVHPTDDDIVPDNVRFNFNTVVGATIGALNDAAGEPVVIDGGVVVPDMPANASIVGSPGYRAGIDASLYNMTQAELQAVHVHTHRNSAGHARQTAIRYDIPLGQQVHAFMEFWKKQPRRSRPKLHDFLDEVMPGMKKRTRQRHLKVFAIVSSYDWPVMVATAEEDITGMESILRVARAFSTQPPRTKKTPLKERYLALRQAVQSKKYAEAHRLIDQFDGEDAEASSWS